MIFVIPGLLIGMIFGAGIKGEVDQSRCVNSQEKICVYNKTPAAK